RVTRTSRSRSPTPSRSAATARWLCLGRPDDEKQVDSRQSAVDSEKTEPRPVDCRLLTVDSSMSNHGFITGTGAVCPLGRTAPEFARRLFAGETAIRPMTPEEQDALQATHVARCDGFTPQPEIPAMKARRFDRGSQFAIIACGQA